MDMKKIYGLVLVFFMLVFTACGTNTKEDPKNSGGPYSFFNATTPLTITLNRDINGTVINTSYDISVQLLEYGLVKAGEIIEMKPFEFQYGFVTNNLVLTDTNGIAKFTYNFPNDYSKIKGQDIIIQAVYFDPTQIIVNVPNRNPTQRKILLTQDFLLQFR